MFRKFTNILSLIALVAVIILAFHFVFFANNGGNSPCDTEAQSNGTNDSPQPPISGPIVPGTPEPGTPERPPDVPALWQLVSLDDIYNTEYLILVNRQFAIPRDIENELVRTSARVRSTNNNVRLHESALDALVDMFASAHAAGFTNLMLASGFRTIASQTSIYNNGTPGYVMPPFHSEHNTGFAADITFVGRSLREFANTPASRWMRENSWRYGFILRYPADKTHITSINYEPWHFRFVGVPHAYYIHTNGLALEEYIELLQERGSLRIEVEGRTYYIYRQVPVGGQLNLPTDREFIVSSDNKGGYIITAWRA